MAKARRTVRVAAMAMAMSANGIKKRSVVAVGLMLVAGGMVEVAPTQEGRGARAQAARPLIEGDVAREVHARINAERTHRGLVALRWDETTAAIAAAHSRDMAARDYFAHEDPSGRTIRDRMSGLVAACEGWGTGENIMWLGRWRGHGVPARAVADWMASPGHRANILRGRFNRTGIGVALTGDRVYLTQNFWWCDGR